jgi:hypothetical protein
MAGKHAAEINLATRGIGQYTTVEFIFQGEVFRGMVYRLFDSYAEVHSMGQVFSVSYAALHVPVMA